MKYYFNIFRKKTARCPRKCGHLAVEKRCPYNPSYIVFLAFERRKMIVENSRIRKSAILSIIDIKSVIPCKYKDRINVPNF